MKFIPKKMEQHTLASQWLHEIAEWEPPRLRRRKPPAQLEGHLDLVEAVAEVVTPSRTEKQPPERANEPSAHQSGVAE